MPSSSSAVARPVSPPLALVKVGKVAQLVRQASKFGLEGVPDPTAVKADMDKVRAYLRQAIDTVHAKESPERLRERGIEVLLGTASFITNTRLRIDMLDGTQDPQMIDAEHVLLCTGARPRIPDFVKASDAPFLTYERIFELEELPEHLIVVGGGPLGCEMAQACCFRRLGSQVTIMARSILPREDVDASDALRAVFDDEGIALISEKACALRKGQNGQGIEVEGDSRTSVAGSHVLFAVGSILGARLFESVSKTKPPPSEALFPRVPILDRLNLSNAGIDYEEDKGITVNEYLHTNIPHIYGAGDCIGGHQYTHYAGWQAVTAIRNMALPLHSKGFPSLIPNCTFTDPEVASVGLGERDFLAQHPHGLILKRKMQEVDRAICENDGDHGFIKLLVNKHFHLLGATVVGPRAGELLGELTVCMHNDIKVTDLAKVMHAYPSFAFELQAMAADLALEHVYDGFKGKLAERFKKV
ncbi:uncharacterized protein MONBRDRAFT_22530 [Monosiga brevicollis MX1]|uniref:Uncharacterized protein n=1 Tax=Monosiga brevicollis TaxID=81824 RepID=A9UQV0_MONBE|nr:uncharacterized protein MONBRDRAFT_22530 [Monosiga brevicollis MX1]EDQ92661.1 predicted protein [Monosiga brevicollis MX1]|eukprot:XP_001742423.1 hypothetical protein [Monosiga brevicollis MX1]